jgi:hypothetical protein
MDGIKALVGSPAGFDRFAVVGTVCEYTYICQCARHRGGAPVGPGRFEL